MSKNWTLEEEVIITPANEGSFVTVDDCKSCPEDSACKGNKVDSKGAHFCMCYHFKPLTPLRKGGICLRNTVNISSRGYPVHHQPIPVQVSGDGARGRNWTTPPPSTAVLPSLLSSTSVTIALLVFSLFSLLLLSICVLKRKSLYKVFNKKSKSKIEMVDLRQGNNPLLSQERFVSNPTYESTCMDLAIRVFTPQEVHLLTQIGHGCFGKVFKGALGGEDVAIKMVKKEYSDEAIREVETMATFCHPNILHLIGVVKSADSDAPWLVFEFMKHGDLVSVLRNSGHSFPRYKGQQQAYATPNKSPSAVGENGVDMEELIQEHLPLSPGSLLDFTWQIAEGMKYLSSQHFVHRDLAARNCLVSASGVVKISDFGLSRDVYTCDYYKIGGSRLLPLRWMAPESILYGRFTLESDVWAYGVLLWEIFTWGKQPYFGHSNEEVVQLILEGVLLCPPSDCPSTICAIMEGCWKTEPKDRLKFTQIVQRLSAKEASKSQEKSSTTTTLQCWIESGYEVPTSIVQQEEYLHVL